MTTRRAIYRHGQLARLFNPKSVAIIGASPRAGSFGERTQNSMAHFSGNLYLVNPRYEEIGGLKSYPSVTALPEAPDCAIIVAAREAVEPLVEECIAKGVGGAMIYASGYSETGKPDRIEQQIRLRDLARAGKMPIVGPNCIGMLNFSSSAGVTFMAVPKLPAPGKHAVGLISQSGALGFSLAQAHEKGASFSHLLTTGNSADIDIADCIAFLADDPNCTAIGCVFEGMPDPMRLIEAGQIAEAANKPLVIYKLGTGEQGAAAAMSHTGSLAGSWAAYRAAFERAGAILVDQFEALVETASFLSKAPAPKAKGVAVLAVSGGSAIMAADRAEAHGVPLPQPAPHTQAALESRIPEFGSARNPCDVTAQVANDPDSLTACAEAMLNDPVYGTLVYPQIYAADTAPIRRKALSEIGGKHGKPIVVIWTTEWQEGPGAIGADADPNVSMFRSTERAFAAMAAWHARGDRRAAGPRKLVRVSPESAAAEAGRLLDAVAPGATLTEREAKQVLAAYGVPVVQETLTQNADEAVAAAKALGWPVAIKVESPDLPHKTEAGVIRLNLRDEAAMRDAFATVLANGKRYAPDARINGVLVQPMAKPGVEIMVGARMDPMFGPLIVVGLGGILVELMRDSATALAPINVAEAKSLLERLKGSAALKGFRGAPAADMDRLAEIVVRLSEFASDQRDRVAELDVNPIIVSGSDAVAVDALIVRAGA
jgi:acyl-CoA synthetase (NDP forming)